ncbi:MAG TPA: hypothetical protein VL860_10410, partial [Planctomycetota bacterium]|nr:hypothetical protein [Planctomycetota bacterium]
MLKSICALITAAVFSFTLTVPLFAEEPAPPTPAPTPAGTEPGATLPDGTKVSDTPTTTVQPTKGPDAPAAGADAATGTVATGAGAQAATAGNFNYSFRMRLGASAWFGQHFESVYKSSTSDLRGQAVPDKIDWVNSLDAKLDSITVVPELEFCFGIYQYLRFQYYRYNFSGNSTAPKNENYGDIFYPAGTPWKGKGYLEQFDVLYEIALVKQPPMATKLVTFEWRLGIGIKVVSYDFEIQAAGGGMLRYDPVGTTSVASVHEKDSQTIPIPIASNYIEVNLGQAPMKFGFFLDTQWISTPKLVINGDKLLAQLTDIKTGL